jgi:carnitine-CoA ligase
MLNDSRATIAVVEDHYLDRILAVAGDLTFLRTLVIRGKADPAGAASRSFQVVPFGELETAAAQSPVVVAPR